MISSFCVFYTFKETLFCDIHQTSGFCADFTDRMGSGRIGMIALVDQSRIQADDVALFQTTSSFTEVQMEAGYPL